MRIIEMCSVPLSGSHTSPGRPWIWRTLALARAKAKRSKRSLPGSKRKIALLPQSLTQTLSVASTQTA